MSMNLEQLAEKVCGTLGYDDILAALQSVYQQTLEQEADWIEGVGERARRDAAMLGERGSYPSALVHNARAKQCEALVTRLRSLVKTVKARAQHKALRKAPR